MMEAYYLQGTDLDHLLCSVLLEISIDDIN